MPKNTIKTLFEGVEGLTSDFESKVENIVEAVVKERSQNAVNEAVTTLQASHDVTISELNESHVVALQEAETQVMENFVPILNVFLENAVMKWAADNATGIDSKLKLEAAEKFLTGLGGLFTESNIELPEKTSIVEGYETKIAELSAALDTAQSSLLETDLRLKEDARDKLVESVIQGLTDTQADQVRTLTEGDDWSDLEKFGGRVKAYRNLVEAKSSEGDDGDDGDDGEKDPKKEPKKEPKKIEESVDPIIAAALNYI